MLNKKTSISQYGYATPIILVSILVLVLSLTMHWQGDAIAFSFFMPRYNEDFSQIKFNSVLEIWQSMSNHYMHSTGRFFSHGLAQFFCAFAGKTWFSIFNSIAWGFFIIAILKLSCPNKLTLTTSSIASLLTYILFYSFGGSEHSFPFEPPHQIDYVWMGALNLCWVWFFFTKKEHGGILILFLSILSFICGQSNESFSIPIGGALLFFAFKTKFKLSVQQWMMGIAYGIGAFIVILAPGNFARLANDSGNWSIMHTIERIVPALIIPAVYILVLLCYRRKKHTHLSENITQFLIIAIIINYILGIYIGMGSGTRILTCANSFLIILIIQQLGYNFKSNLISSICIALIALLSILRLHAIFEINTKNITIEKMYHQSVDGVVVIPDEMFLYKANQFIVRPHPYMMIERADNPSKPNIRIRPQTMSKLNLDKDTNIIIQLDSQAWLMIQSRLNPAKFVVKKTLMPGLINRRMSDRVIDWSQKASDIVFDSTALWKAAIYINPRKYIDSHVSIEKY